MKEPRYNPRLLEIPADVLEELRNTPLPSDEELARFDHIRPDFIRMLGSASQETLVDLVLSWTGKVIETARNVQAEFLTGGPQPAWACRGGARGSYRSITKDVPTQKRAPGPPPNPRMLAEKECGAYRIILEYYLAPAPYLAIDVFDKTNNIEVRPFTVTVFADADADADTMISGPTTIELGQSAPRFPEPKAGCYVFQFEWEGGSDSLTLTIQSEAS